MIPDAAAILLGAAAVATVSGTCGFLLAAALSSRKADKAADRARRETENLFHAHGISDPRESSSIRTHNFKS